MSKGFDLQDYVDVAARLEWFFSNYPEGSLQSEVTHLSDNLIIVKAMAYRTTLDTTPGIGHASEVVPGRTPYTKDSELMNAESSAWGRALAAIGAPTKGHVASRNEVQAASARKREAGDQTAPATAAEPAAAEQPPGAPASRPPPDHKHTWEPSPTMKSFVVCTDPSCRKVERKDKASA